MGDAKERSPCITVMWLLCLGLLHLILIIFNLGTVFFKS